MSAPVLTFFNNKGGVGKTSLVYHLSWMFASLDICVVVADLDPQANLTAAFLDEDAIDTLWGHPASGATIFQCVQPLTEVGDMLTPKLHKAAQNLYLLPGDVSLSGFEDTLSEVWLKSLDEVSPYRAMRIQSAFWQVVQNAAEQVDADLILVDIGPNLGAINRSALLAADYVAIPLGADLFSLQGLRNLGPTMNGWRKGWGTRLANWAKNPQVARYPDFRLPQGAMTPIGYLCQQHGVRLDRPVKAYDKWVRRMPAMYRSAVLGEDVVPEMLPSDDAYCLATIKHYRSLIPMGQEHRKPIFHLTAADGAIGSHAHAVQDAKKDFRKLAGTLAAKMNLEL